jgi:3'-phosphoadenosine 5'-phosphosulfate sulfotransferase (PAPS reductase)/FAD synthetase
MKNRDDTIAVVSLSGGKDSQATAICAIDAYGKERVRLVMADTGHEHPEHMAFVREYLPDAMGIPVQIVKADFTKKIERKRQFIKCNWEYMGVPLSHIDRALELLRPTGNPFLDLCTWKGRFPSRKAQFCTQELKRQPLNEYLLNVMSKHPNVESWQGVRRDESASRADALPREIGDHGGWIVRPIVDWTAQQTVDFVLSRGQRLSPLYSQGMRRVGCMPCINCSKNELLEISKRWPEEITRVREWEEIVAECSKRGQTTFFADNDTNDNVLFQREYARIDKVVEWTKTSRGGRQFDFLRSIPPSGCSSDYGLCE